MIVCNEDVSWMGSWLVVRCRDRVRCDMIVGNWGHCVELWNRTAHSMIIADNPVTRSCNQELCAVLCAALEDIIMWGRGGWSLISVRLCVWLTTWTFIIRNLLEPVRKSWTIVMLVGVQSLLEPVRKSWTFWVLCAWLSQSGSAGLFLVLVSAEPAWASQEELDYGVVWGIVMQ